MSGDYSRFTDRPLRRYSGVRMQQGRVQLDADWNEEVAILKRRWETQALDTFGPCAVPEATTPDGFEVTLAGTDLKLGAGRIYVHGRLAEIFAGEEVGGEPVSYLHQPFDPQPDPLPGGSYAVYLDVWDREVTCIEDPDLLEKALGGPDTATRIQTVWQVKVQKADGSDSPAECGTAVGVPASTGRLSTRAIAPPASDDPCILSPTGGYRGIENRLYRVEVHDRSGGTTRFKWSRENASVVSAVTDVTTSGTESRLAVTRIGRDAVLRFQIDDWVEVLDDHLELKGLPGQMLRVKNVLEATRTLVLDGVASGFGANPAELSARHTRVRRWDQRNGVDANGLLAVGSGWIALEDGVEVSFSPAGGTYRTGDHWSFAARTVDGSVEELKEAPPLGIHHFYCQLAAVNGTDVHDCRPLWPDCECGCCCTIEVGNGKESHGDFDDLVEAVQALTTSSGPLGKKLRKSMIPIAICLLPGTHRLRETVVVDRSFVTIRGCRELAPVIGPDQAPAFEVLGSSVRLENLFVTAASGMPAVVSQGADGLEIVDNRLRNSPDHTTEEGTESGLILLEVGTQRARIVGNELANGDGHGIAVAIGFHEDIVIAGNEIRRMEGSGIASIESRAPEDEQRSRLLKVMLQILEDSSTRKDGETTSLFGSSHRNRRFRIPSPRSANDLRIEHNTIVGCVGLAAKPREDGPPYGGIVLLRAARVQISDNRIEGNGTAREKLHAHGANEGQGKIEAPVAGIYVHTCRGLIVRDNVVLDNGPAPDEGDPIPGLQGGILGLELAVQVEQIDVMPGEDEERFAPIQPDGWPAASIQNNLVVAPRGLALVLEGIGPMQVTGNRFTARERAEGKGGVEEFLDLFGAVAILNAGWPAYLVRQFLSFSLAISKKKIENALTDEPEPERFTVGGKVDFSNNQVHLDLVRGEADFAVAAVGILTLDDLALQDNQTECTLSVDFLFTDVLAIATTLRATGNGFTESFWFCPFSLFAIGLLMCTVTSNQGTHCINAYALDSPIAKLISRDNTNLFSQFMSGNRYCGLLRLDSLQGGADPTEAKDAKNAKNEE